ncbi:PTS beta-glucoside transporter subunit IIABC [Paenibacillus sp. FSL R7-0273]|uniref:beta-glucoside-specific PTS transporter subunit IIABC n=1 Tax=Paenibacillus sp. FSL R7-0273 TaxID=1536772 RepID=UPI0004F8BF3F|nr:beta-glucoside-specific PTS transporter subunit IIABC [Paenibacillus sp. FSL R7-0273]AIQ48516.1 PTS beta-glucoside transporter subunit IIABC [Paenibacillus sp. FSL R7-0273]OMF84077.1 PTS beta-glucoside transporter subunit IIABC [Paenibacillus sp. FSL R7-0273]
MDSQKLAGEIIRNVGGRSNISHLEHCVTRLRFTLKDESAAQTDTINNLDGVMTVVKSGGQYQVVIGNKVKEVYKEVTDQLGGAVVPNDAEAAPSGKKKNAFNRFVDVIVGIISPIIGLLAAAGIIKGMLGLATALDWLAATDGTYILLNALGDGLFYFMPIIVGFSAGRKFGGNPFIPAAIGAALVYPSVITAYNAGDSLTFAGIPIVLASYTSSLFPIILAAWVAAKLEKWFERKLPASLRLFFVPLFTILITGILTFLLVGPVLTEASSLLADATMWIYNLSPVVAGVVLGGLWQLIVIFGLHYAFIPVLINNITTLQYDPVNAILSASVFAQVGAALGVFLKSRNAKVRSIAGPAAISAFMGVTEPAIYGISLPYKKPFAMAGIAGAVGGGITAAMSAKMFGFGGGGIFAAPLFINPAGLDNSFYAYVIASAVAVVIATVLTYLFGFKDKQETPAKAPAASGASNTALAATMGTKTQVYNSIQGTIIPLSEVPDEAFASGAMGSGYAVIPADNKVYAPFDGTVVTVANSKHAVAMVSDDGVELLIHMGINTVKLKGAPFELKVQENDRVQKGQLLAVVDWNMIRDNKFEVTTPVIVTNTADHESVELKADRSREAKTGELVLSIR